MSEIYAPQQLCKNCGHSFEEHFCNRCGQKAAHRITIPHVLHDLVHVFLHADKGIFTFMSRLLVQPGILAKEFISGKRKIFNPFQYLIFSVGLVLFLVTQANFYENLDSHNNEMAARFSSTFQQAMAQFNLFVRKHNNIISFLTLPIYAFYSWLFFRKKGENYAEHLTLVVFVMSFVYTLNALALLALILFHFTGLDTASIPLILICIAFTLTYYQFYKVKWITALFKALSVYACSFLTQIVIMMVLFFLYFFMLKSQ